MTETVTAPAPGQSSRRPLRRGALLAIVLTGQFMALVDVAIVNVAAPSIRNNLHSSGAGLQLVIAGYTISYAVFLITGARLGDLFGHRRIFLTGLVVFTLASLACGLAGNTGELIAFRLVQGGGAALMVPQVLSVIQRNFEGQERAKALSRFAAVVAGGAIVGQVVGGALVSANLFGSDWRPVFLVNVPIGAVLLVTGLRLLPIDHGERRRGLDVPGLVTLAAAVLLLVLPLVLGHDEGWPLWGWICLGASVVLFAAFVRVERHARAPLVPGRVLRSHGMLASIGAIFLTLAAYGSYLFVFALHLQTGLGFSPLRSGLTFVPAAATFAFASLSWPRIPPRWHREMITSGLVLATGGLALMALAVHSGNNPGTVFWISQVVYGVGIGSAVSPLLTLALSRVPPTDAADASGMLTTTVQLAQVIGVATFGTLYLTMVSHSPSGHSTAITALYEVIAMAFAAVCGALLPGRRASAPAGPPAGPPADGGPAPAPSVNGSSPTHTPTHSAATDSRAHHQSR